MRSPKILVFDSGLGGLTVYRQLKKSLPTANTLYVADNAAFPYGNLREPELVARLQALFAQLIKREQPDACVLACNTASTIALAPLRDQFDIPFVGTVPAIKTAAELSQTKLFSVLATPGTVRRQYTRELIDKYASQCEVTLVGAIDLARLAEQFMAGKPIEEAEILREIAPAFVEKADRRTDVIVLGCTHFPLLTKEMKKVSPWKVTFIDPAPAIARRTKVVLSQLTQSPLLTEKRRPNRLIYTGGDSIVDKSRKFLQDMGFEDIYRDASIG